MVVIAMVWPAARAVISGTMPTPTSTSTIRHATSKERSRTLRSLRLGPAQADD